MRELKLNFYKNYVWEVNEFVMILSMIVVKRLDWIWMGIYVMIDVFDENVLCVMVVWVGKFRVFVFFIVIVCKFCFFVVFVLLVV